MTPQTKPRYSIIIPVYNSVGTLDALASRIGQVLAESIGASYEILMVDDASPNPETWPTLVDLAKRDPHVRALQLTRNFGRHPAVICGLTHARGEYVVTMDDDLQHRPEDLPLLIAQQHHDIVFANFSRKNHGYLRRMASSIKGWFDVVLIGKPPGVYVSAFLLTNERIKSTMLQIATPFPFIPALLFFVSRDAVGVQTVHAPRMEGKSGYTLRKLLSQFFNLLIGNSSFLLRMISLIGSTVSLLSFLFAVVIVVRKVFVGIDVPGWATLVVATSVLQGLVLLGIGVMGEYLLRLLVSSEHRPCYVLRTEASAHRAAAPDGANSP